MEHSSFCRNTINVQFNDGLLSIHSETATNKFYKSTQANLSEATVDSKAQSLPLNDISDNRATAASTCHTVAQSSASNESVIFALVQGKSFS